MMSTCRHCGQTIRRERSWPSGSMMWKDTAAIVCGAFCPAVEGRDHEPDSVADAVAAWLQDVTS